MLADSFENALIVMVVVVVTVVILHIWDGW